MLSRVVAFVALGFLVTTASNCRAGTETEYEVRPASLCPTINHPPSVEEATALIRCTGDEDNPSHGYVTRTENVQVQIGTPRAYTYGDPGSREINPDAPVLPIRGVKTDFRCAPVSNYMQNSGKNCSSYQSKGATGICYQTTFSDWKCVLPNLIFDAVDGIAGPQ